MENAKYLTPNYAQLPVTFVKGKGAYLYDDKGIEYLDALSGVAVMSLGHSHPELVNAICEQAHTLMHTSNWYNIKPQQDLAARLCALSDLDMAFFCNSGAEANETAIKATRLFAKTKDITQPVILTACKSFHGRTMATLSATGNPKVKKGFAPLVGDFETIIYNDINEVTRHTTNPNVVAVMLEPVLGEAGVVVPDESYLTEVRQICDEQGWLLIADEVQTGIARTGAMFAYEHSNITPDILTLAKGLGSGFPIGACIFNAEIGALLSGGTHGTTFGGNHLATTTALKVLDIIEQDNIITHVQTISAYFKRRLAKIDDEKIKEIRIKGLMIGIELHMNPAPLLLRALDNRLLINITGNSIRLLPPLIITTQEVDKIVDTLNELIHNL